MLDDERLRLSPSFEVTSYNEGNLTNRNVNKPIWLGPIRTDLRLFAAPKAHTLNTDQIWQSELEI